MKSVMKKLVLKIAKFINAIIPKKYVSFCSNPDFSDNPFALYDYIQKNIYGKQIVYIWHLQKKDNVLSIQRWIDDDYSSNNGIKTIITTKYSMKSIWLFMRSKTIVTSHGLYDFKTKKQNHIYVLHGMPLKKCGYLNEKDAKDGVALGDFYSVTSSIYKEVFKQAFHSNEKQILIDGQCRNDLIFQKREMLIEISDYILYLPTFRNTNSSIAFHRSDINTKCDELFNLTLSDWNLINKLLKEKDIKLVIKPHPLDDIKNISYITGLEQIKLIDDTFLLHNRIQLSTLMAHSKALITDYSSVYIDYLLTGKPICFFIPDLDDYEKNRGLIFSDYKDTMAGTVCKDNIGFIRFLENPINSCSDYQRISSFFNEIQEEGSSKKLTNDLGEYLF